MDVRDITEQPPQLDPEKHNIFFEVWSLQEKLVADYIKIEGLPQYPIQLNTRTSQNLIKDFISRVVEELAEAYEAWLRDDPILWKEELADALHFLMEIFIYTYPNKEAAVKGYYQPDLLLVDETSVRPADNNQAPYWNVVYHLNLARNHLRNKDWKQTQVLPKVAEFYAELHRSLYALNHLFRVAGLNPIDVWEMYWKKNQVNQFRIKSKY